MGGANDGEGSVPDPDPDPDPDPGRPARPRREAGLYEQLCQAETLWSAYARLTDNHPGDERGGAGAADALVGRLRGELRDRAYRPGTPGGGPEDAADQPATASAGDRIVLTALRTVLGLARPAGDAGSASATGWVAATVGRGWVRAYAVDLAGGFQNLGDRFAEAVADRCGDREVAGLMVAFRSAPLGPEEQGLFDALARDVLYAGVDRILGQAAAIGGGDAYFGWARFGHEVALLADPAPRHDWLVPAVERRVHDELRKLRFDPDRLAAQSVTLTDGRPLRLGGAEFRVTGRGRLHVRHESAAPRGGRRWPAVSLPRILPKVRAPHPIRLPHLPGWMSRASAGFLLTGRGVVRAVRALDATRVDRRRLRAAGSALFAATRRHWMTGAAAACALVALGSLGSLGRDLYANASGERPAPRQPAGFFVGQYNPDPLGGREPVPYGLYVPPHFRGQDGPFPLIVFLNGYGERTRDKVFAVGVPRAVATKFGEHTGNGRFEFAVFLPVDPTANWEPGTPEVDDALAALDYVVRRHRIDPKRVYLTGLSKGGGGAWRLAEAYPDRWAAVAPVCSPYQPNLGKVRPIPIHMYNGELDRDSPAEMARSLRDRLAAVGADVKYLELPGKGHLIWREVYNDPRFYDWLRTTKRLWPGRE